MKSIIEGERALCFWLSQQTEVSLNHPDEKTRQEASDYVSLMTPVVKSLFTDLAMEIRSDAMQIHGGYGYTKDQGIEQLYSCLLYTSPSPRDGSISRMPSSA